VSVGGRGEKEDGNARSLHEPFTSQHDGKAKTSEREDESLHQCREVSIKARTLGKIERISTLKSSFTAFALKKPNSPKAISLSCERDSPPSFKLEEKSRKNSQSGSSRRGKQLSLHPDPQPTFTRQLSPFPSTSQPSSPRDNPWILDSVCPLISSLRPRE